MFSIVKNYKMFFAVTVVFIMVGIGSMFMQSFNLGIDFTGGSIIDLKFGSPVSVSQVRDVLKEHERLCQWFYTLRISQKNYTSIGRSY